MAASFSLKRVSRDEKHPRHLASIRGSCLLRLNKYLLNVETVSVIGGGNEVDVSRSCPVSTRLYRRVSRSNSFHVRYSCDNHLLG